MQKPLHIWILFGLCLLVALAAVGWVTVTTLHLDRAQMEAARQAELEEKVRLALWRMDSAMMPLFVEESARPASAYQAFYGAEQAFTKGGASIKSGDVLLPSPLLAYASSNVLLHFDFVAGQVATSPQAPVGRERELAVAGYVEPARVSAFAARLDDLRKFLQQPADAGVPPVNPPDATSAFLSSVQAVQPQQNPNLGLNNGEVLLNELPPAVAGQSDAISPQQAQAVINAQVPSQPVANDVAQGLNAQPQPSQQQELNPMQQRYDNRGQIARNTVEYNTRGNFYQQAGQAALASINNTIATNPDSSPASSEGLFKAVWLGDRLLLVRRVAWDGRTHIQGCWLNWESIRKMLLASARDLLPEADLRPVPPPRPAASERMLAALPVKLVPGPLAAVELPVWSPVRTLLAVAWIGILLAALASAVLLQGILALSERRAAFVSAVTHELRTPLTTFKMYSEMLADGMVAEETQRRHYLNTLCAEANRLSHLVENVLAYARLERGSARRNVERVSLQELIRRVEPRLAQRAQQAGLALAVDADQRALATGVHVDVSAVEQILFNLVDNACKYAGPGAAEKVIHLEAFSPAANGRHAMLRVRDHGQGISAEGAQRLFEPFCKSAHEAAHTAPGVGLGLALSRRLSRSLGGDLRWVANVKSGACFELALPVQAAG